MDNKLAISAHLFYPDLAVDLLTRLARYNGDFTLFATHSAPLDASISLSLKKLGRPVHLLRLPNQGRDVGAFVGSLRHPAMQGHEYVLKLHTKRGSLDIGDFWRTFFFERLIGNLAQVTAVFEADKSLKLAGPKEAYIESEKFMYGNRWYVNDIRSILGFRGPPVWGFFAGTMFFSRRAIFDPLLNLERHYLQFTDEERVEDGKLEHALERIFGLMPHLCDGRVGLIGPDGQIETLNGVGKPARKAISQTMRDLQNSLKRQEK